MPATPHLTIFEKVVQEYLLRQDVLHADESGLKVQSAIQLSEAAALVKQAVA